MYSEVVLGSDFKNLKGKKVVIVGVGGTGNYVAQLLSKLPLSLTLIDRDLIEKDNLERQVLFSEEDVGKSKVSVAQEKLGVAEVKFEDLNETNINFDCDLVIDCTDNMETRFIINDYCKKNNIPWIYTGAIGKIGNVFFIKDNACFSCFNSDKTGDTCNSEGVLNTTVSLIGSLAASLAIDYLASGKVEENMLRLSDNKISKIKITNNKECKACNGIYEYLSGEKVKKMIKFCSRGRFHVFLNKELNLDSIEKKLMGEIRRDSISVSNEDFVVFSHGRVIIHADELTEAKKKFDEVLGI